MRGCGLMFALAVTAALALASVSAPALAEEGKRDPTRQLRGEITKIDGASITIGIRKERQIRQEETVTAAADVEVIIEGAPGKLADLQVGQIVEVTVKDGSATRIEVPKPPAPKVGGEGEGKREGDAPPPARKPEGERD